MKENSISDIEAMARDYDNVEKMIAQCAHLALDAVKAKLYNTRPVENSVQANYNAIYNCFNCYKSSHYAAGTSDEYKLRIDRLLRDIAEDHLPMACYNQKHYDLILPVLMFHYIVTYESNPESTAKRERKNKEKQKSKNEDIKWGKKFPDKPATLIVARKERNKKLFSNVIDSSRESALEKNYASNDLIPDNIKNACEGIFSLSDQYEKIKLCADYSRAGCFLYDLLSIGHNTQKPLDTILRLYMVSELHDILTNTRYILRGEAYATQSESNSPLNQYVCERCDFSNPYPVRRSRENALSKVKTLNLDSKTKQVQFEQLYNHLSEEYIFQTPDILDFFLNKEILEPCAAIDEVFKKYAKALSELMNVMPYLTKTESTSGAVIRMVNLFREDKLQESWERSEQNSIMKDIQEILSFADTDKI